MPKIIELPPHMADLIAAGEVVERPGSVVKELMENSIDAGAGAVTVEIQGGGLTYIRVTDDGCGIAPEDARTAFLRHATSKLRDERGLENIRTLGFRGEALAATAAVSRIDLMTRERGAAEGIMLSLEGGVVTDECPAGCPDGSTIVVRDLFYNTPARLKFMKKDSAEAANVSQTVARCALSHPSLSVRYIKDGKEELHTPGDGRVDSCIYSVLGRDFSRSLLKVSGESDSVTVTGFVTSPAAARASRSQQFFFLNGRYIKSALLQAALEQAFKNALFTGRFPGCVLYVGMSAGAVDVNVHPAKTEVKFAFERQVFDAVYYSVLSALQRESGGPELSAPRSGEEKPPERTLAAAPKAGFFKTLPVDEYRKAAQPSGRAVETYPQRVARERASGRESVLRSSVAILGGLGAEPVAPPKPAPQFVSQSIPYSAPYSAPSQPAQPQPAAAASPEEPAGLFAAPPERYSIIGEVFAEYIVVEREDELLLIDKHAAHERLLFDALKSKKRQVMAQLLLAPLTVRPGVETAALLLENSDLLSALGFDIEDFGGGALLLRQVPADMDVDDGEALLSQLARDLKNGGRPGYLSREDEILSTVACKAAIKAGRVSDARELEPLVKSVLSGEIKYCPHGRPVSTRLSKAGIDRSFKRT